MAAMIRLALVQCPVWGVDDPPLGLAQLLGCVAHCNHHARPFDLNVRLWKECAQDEKRFWSREALPLWNDRPWTAERARAWEAKLARYAEDILSDDPQAVLFWAAEGSQWFSLEAAKRVKAKNAAVKIFIGGPYFNAASRVDAFIAEPCLDGVIAGSADDLLAKLLGLYQACGRWMPLPGMTVKEKGMVERGGRPVPFTFDWDLAPLCDFSGFATELYRKPLQMPVASSRGCHWSHPSCARDYWGKYSFKSGDRIFSEVAKALQGQKFWRHVRFYDLDANGKPDSLKRFSEMILENRLSEAGLTWSARVSLDSAPDAQRLELFARAGCREIVYGLETEPSAETAGAAERILRETHAAGIGCIISAAALDRFGAWVDGVEAERTVLDAPARHRGLDAGAAAQRKRLDPLRRSLDMEWSPFFSQGAAGLRGSRCAKSAALAAH
ncbi:MAG: hypothetical protein KGL04_08375 [Elusimicrobia bacterium]|nr:hypothetical protein [Elusimicrobiota bacterium]